MKSIPGPWMVVLLAGILGACGRNYRAQDSGTVPESANTVNPSKSQAAAVPPSCRLPTKPAELRRCTRVLEFDPLELAGDQQRLRVCKAGTCGYGPLATIQPEKRSYEGDLTDGRIIARMFLNPGEKDDYSKLGLTPRDTTYWWVQKDSGRSTGRSIYIRISGDTLVTAEDTLRFQPYRLAPRQALARWLWAENDEKTQGTCGSGTCQ
jgi:hypothetical protein